MKTMSIYQKIQHQSHEPNLLAEVYEACRQKQAFLFVRERAGFVLRPVRMDGKRGVIVWLAWSECSDGLVRYTPDVIAHARQINAAWLRFWTARKGFLRIAPALGWQRIADDDNGLYGFEMKLEAEQ